jgi:hypothetical protein
MPVRGLSKKQQHNFIIVVGKGNNNPSCLRERRSAISKWQITGNSDHESLCLVHVHTRYTYEDKWTDTIQSLENNIIIHHHYNMYQVCTMVVESGGTYRRFVLWVHATR